jgi:hypothetical protein
VVDTLLVVEAPPSALDRYFYFEDVSTHDSLFRHVVAVVTGEKPTRDKLPYLDDLRERGFFLVDMSIDPFRSRDVLPGCVPGLVRRVRALGPRRVILIGVAVYDTAFSDLRSAGVPVVDARIPFPGSGQQRRFNDAFRAALSSEDPVRPPTRTTRTPRRPPDVDCA